MGDELTDIMKHSISIQNQTVLRNGKAVNGAYRDSIMAQEFQSDDEDEDYEIENEGDSDSDTSDMDEEENAGEDADEADDVTKEEVQATIINTAGISDATGQLLMTPSKVLRHGKQIEPVNKEDIGDLASRIKELMQQPLEETVMVR
ncbi:hypothetical protein HDV00_003037 [Rhizophlyctis rosea]|nr:hypothetical protein HDV00_003037 [Rhizophlyctis rosea]